MRRHTFITWVFLACFVSIRTSSVVIEPERMICDVCVIGGGSGGFGAALAAARAGAQVILIEKQPVIGGTSTSAFVTNWEPGPGCSFAREIYNRLKSKPGSVGVASKVHSYERNEPYGINIGTIGEELTYDSTLRRAGIPANKRYSVVMKTEALAQTMESMLKKAGVEILLNTTFIKAETKDGIVLKAHLAGPDSQRIVIRAGVFIDATGGALLCRNIGCETMLGADSRERFNEPSAPHKADSFLNAISLCYRIRKVENPKRQQMPSGSVGEFGKTAFATGVDDKELIINPLPLVAGTTLIDKGYQETMSLARKNVLAHWHWLQEYPHFKSYELKDIAPMLGIRESYRVMTEYILTEHDVRAGLKKQQHNDIVAIADHALDVHGGSSGIKELKEPYGIPYRCLIPRGWKNLLVACRGAGFSHIAASSCRLSRTMIALGHAAGLAAAEAAREKIDVRDINIKQLVHEMGVMTGEAQGKCALIPGYAQENFSGTVVQQRYIRIEFRTPVKLHESISMCIKRLELGRYQMPYHREVERFIQSLDVGSAHTLFEAALELGPNNSDMFQYEDHAVKQGYTYIYWLQSSSGKIIAGPLSLKVRDPNVWWSQEEIENTMDRLTRNYPGVVEKCTFGKTHESNPINGLLVGNLNNAIVLIGNIHAGESGAELLLYSIEQILAHNKDLLKKTGIIIIPALNIDSRNRLINGIPDYQRKNINGVDLNRNFPAAWEMVDSSYSLLTNDPFSATYRGPSPASEPETKTVIRMLETYRPKVVFAYHWMGCITGSNLLAYTNKTEVLPELQQYAEHFSEGFYENTGKPPGYKIIESEIPGTLHRYCITKHNIPAYDVEGNREDPVLLRAHTDMATEEDLHTYQQKHYRAILNVLQYLSNAAK